ncbi:glycosyltransferase 87 family protein [Kitasatospora sp. NPDC006697]|uniref:glycosyltransferase 87 family protein n=1 Tax=Kitasatospora sp. NPDC006697 TaxID=3364020 RepID=UPI003699772F
MAGTDVAGAEKELRWPRSTPGRIAVLALVAVVCGVFLEVIPGRRGWFDVNIYYETVRSWQHGGRIYDYLRPGTGYGFTYPPFAAVCLAPLGLVGWHAALAIDLAATVLAGAAVLYWLVDPIARRRGWNRWYGFGLVGCLFAVLNPVRDTFSFGQINLMLMFLVFCDYRNLRRGSRFTGIGIGLATAIKLTPALFIAYLLVTRRRRETLTALGTLLGAVLVGFVAMPQQSRFFWTDALWNTDRIGSIPYISNQSLLGFTARVLPQAAEKPVWLVLTAAVLACWARRSRRAAAIGDQRAGFALTGLTCCLVSPITWVHHLVWMLPALLVLADAGLSSTDRARRRRLLAATAGIWVLLVSGLVWLWRYHWDGVGGLLGGNSYVLVALALLPGMPIGEGAERGLTPAQEAAAPAPARV